MTAKAIGFRRYNIEFFLSPTDFVSPTQSHVILLNSEILARNGVLKSIEVYMLKKSKFELYVTKIEMID
jgi:hypothetical protein